MQSFLKHLWHLTKDAAGSWINDFAPSMGAALAFYTLFSLAPLLIIVIAVAGLVFGQEAAQGGIVAELRGLIGVDGALAVQALLEGARRPAESIVATLVGGFTLLVGATTVFVELQDNLDRIWKAKPRPGSGLWNLLHARLLSFGMILAIGFLLLVSLVFSTVLAALGKYWGTAFGDQEILLQVANFLISFGVITLLFAMIYKWLPRARIAWGDVWIGAGVTALLFTIGKYLIGLYLATSTVASAYGTAGTFVILLLWVYYSAQIFLLGAEFTKIYADRHGSHTQDATAPVENPTRT